MKGIKNNKKGFTLIELLAVIVVLAIVMVLATTTVLPLMNDAKKNSFAIEATDAINSASNLVTVMPLNSVATLSDYRDPVTNAAKTGKTADYNYTNSGGIHQYCFSLKLLATLGFYKKDLSYFNANQYEGKVIVYENTNSNLYKYRVVMHNETFQISEAKGVKSSYTGQDVDAFSTKTGYDCNMTTWPTMPTT